MRCIIKLLLAFALLGLSNVAPVFAFADDFKVSFQVDASAYPIFNLYVTVTDSSGQPVTNLTQDNFQVMEDGKPVTIDSFAGIGDARPVDIVFAFDVTGSMREEIDGVKETCVRFADKLKSSGRDYGLGLVPFRDDIPAIYRADGSLTADVQEFKRWISGLFADGGGDDPEISLDALVRATQMKFRDTAQRIFILITDAPPHHRDDTTGFSNLTVDSTIDALKRANATVYVVGPDLANLPGFGLRAGNEYARLASERGGKFYDIERNSDFTGLIDEIGTTIATQYRLSYRTLRPTPDGTLRGITVTVNREGKTGGGVGKFLEPHLLNVKSSPIIGLGLLIVLGAAALVPLAMIRRRLTPAPTPMSPAAPAAYLPPTPPPVRTPTQAMPPVMSMNQAPPPSVTIVCRQCGAALRPGAKFCAKCGSTQTIASAAPPANCPRCGNTVRAGAKFCNRCGYSFTTRQG